MSEDGIDSVVGKRRLLVFRIASLFLLQRPKGSVSRDARTFNNIEARTVIMFFLQSKVQKEIRAILKETLGEHSPSYGTVKNRVARFRLDDFSTWGALCPGRPKTVTPRSLLINFTN